MKMTYKPTGICCKQMDIEIEGDIVKSVKFTGGCPGGLAAIKKVVEGKTIQEVIDLFDDVTCGNKNTSCVKELCKALKIMRDAKEA